MSDITIVIPLGKGREVDFLDNFSSLKNKVKVIIVRGPNPSRNRNLGARKAQTELIAFVNGHTVLADNWLEEVQKFFLQHPEVDVVGGPKLGYEKDNYFGRVSGYALSSVFGAAKVASRYKPSELNLDADETMLTSANLICRKKVLDSVEFDEDIYPGEDPKFISETKSAGFVVACSPDIRVSQRKRANLSSFSKQIYSYGFMRPKKESLRETVKNPFFLVPSLFVLYLMFLVGLMARNFSVTGNVVGIGGTVSQNVSFVVLLPLILYVLLASLFSAYNIIRSGDYKAAVLLPFLYPTIHISYGTGFLVSSLKRILQKGN